MPIYQKHGDSGFTNLFGLFDIALWVALIPLLCIATALMALRTDKLSRRLTPSLLLLTVVSLLAANSITNQDATSPEPYTSITICTLLFAFVLAVINVIFLIKPPQISGKPAVHKVRMDGQYIEISNLDHKQRAKLRRRFRRAAVQWPIIGAVATLSGIADFMNPDKAAPIAKSTLGGWVVFYGFVLAFAMLVMSYRIFKNKKTKEQFVTICLYMSAGALLPLFFLSQTVPGVNVAVTIFSIGLSSLSLGAASLVQKEILKHKLDVS